MVGGGLCHWDSVFYRTELQTTIDAIFLVWMADRFFLVLILYYIDIYQVYIKMKTDKVSTSFWYFFLRGEQRPVVLFCFYYLLYPTVLVFHIFFLSTASNGMHPRVGGMTYLNIASVL